MTATDLSPNAHVLVLQELRSRFTDAGIPSRTAALDAAISALATHQPVVQEPVELLCVAQTLANGAGQWRTCTGCHESSEGMPTGPYSSIMQCYLGNGCDECGGIGAIWDTTDYQQMADEMSESLAASPAQSVELSPDFTDTARAAIAWVLWHHQGGSSPVGQPLRFSLGMGQHDRMTDQQIAEAKRFAAWAGATTEGFHRHNTAHVVDLTAVRAALDAAEGLAVACASVDCYSREEVAASGRAMTQQFADARAVIDCQTAATVQHPDDLAVDAFAASMKTKMAAARAKGRGGWEDPAQCSADDLSRMLREHLKKGDPRDVANFFMMLHQRGESIVPQEVQVPDNESVRQILGRPNFACIELAAMLRMRGDDIPHRAESEQAAVLRFLLNCYLELPDRWHDNARDKLRRIERQAAEREPNSAPNRLTDTAHDCSQVVRNG
ncbi:TPA: hypothetical protein ACXIMI_001697 [Stenotrophomonas maltophilia]